MGTDDNKQHEVPVIILVNPIAKYVTQQSAIAIGQVRVPIENINQPV